MRVLQGVGALITGVIALGCARAAPVNDFRLEVYPPQIASASPPKPHAASTPAPPLSSVEAKGEAAEPLAAAGVRLKLGDELSRRSLGAGRWVVEVAAPARAYVTIGLAGPRDVLRRFDVLADGAFKRLRAGRVDDDGLLPTLVSFETRDEAIRLMVIVDVDAPVTLFRTTASSAALSRTAEGSGEQAWPLVGLPRPIERRAGYFLQGPPRYQFLRADIVKALREALKQTRIRFRRNAIGIGDASQWNGERPANDLGKPRHISHAGGRDVDIGLPSDDDSPAGLRRRCSGVLVEQDELICSPGTVQHFDALRLAYFLGLLIDGPTRGGRHVPDPARRPGPLVEVETIYTDQAYIDEMRKALEVLRRKRWIHDEAYGALGEDGLLRPSPWHVDHVHVRFRGHAAQVPATFKFASQPPSKKVPGVNRERKPVVTGN